MRTIRLAFAALLAALLASGPAFAGKDLDAVKARGALICGVAANGLAGFMVVSSQGK
jgi:general L-amino acid transport system substrate-binding protein